MSRFGESGWRRWVALGVVVIVAMVIGGVMVGTSQQKRPGVSAARPATGAPGVAGQRATAGPGPAEVAAGVGVGFGHDEAGAVAAAMSYVAAPQAWLYLSDEDVAASVASVTTPEAREELVDDLVGEARLLRDELARASGTTVWFVVSPLATRVEAYDEGRATVRVWAVRVLSAEGVAVPQSGWHTVTLELAWHRGDWRIAGLTEAEGPTPQLEAGLQAWAPGYLADELEGFERVGATP